MEKKAKTNKEKLESNIARAGKINPRGKIFEGVVIKKLEKRIVIEFERMVYISKYERYKRSKTKVHARLPEAIKDKIKIGDYVRVQECRPLSKIIHFIVISKIKSVEDLRENKK
jgi:small subunit ribosomal protein S17